MFARLIYTIVDGEVVMFKNEFGASVPTSAVLVKRNIPRVTVRQREKVLKATEYSMFSFPAGMVTVDYLSDSGSSAMTNLQWASMFLGDESYGRNNGYYVLLDAIRDTFERGDKQKKIISYFMSGTTDIDKLMREVYLVQEEGGFVNGGIHQLTRPNAFIVPQGRCAEALLFSVLGQVLEEMSPGKQMYIPSNGHFDTTEANINAIGASPRNLFNKRLIHEVPGNVPHQKNQFKGNMDIASLESFIRDKGCDRIPLIYMSITNNTIAGQPVDMNNIKTVGSIAKKNGIPFFIDACRFAENACFIKKNEDGYEDVSVQEVIKEMFSYCDGFTISFKKDGLANMGGGLFFRDKGAFWKRFSVNGDIGIRLKEKQISAYGNDSYGGISGRDIFALASGLYEIVKLDYLQNRIEQVEYLAQGLFSNGIPVFLPAGGHGVYLNIDEFFGGKRKPDDFAGVGFTVELLRRYGIRACELGYFAFEWDKKTKDQQEEILNQVRFALSRNVYCKEHLDYTIGAVTELYKDRENIPNMRISRGSELRLRHFQTGLEPVYKN